MKYVRDNNLNKSQLEYVSSIEQLKGHRGVVLLFGRWFRNNSLGSEYATELLSHYRRTNAITIIPVDFDNVGVSAFLS